MGRMAVLGGVIVMTVLQGSAAEVSWLHLSSTKSELPLPSQSRRAAGIVTGDFDRDGTNDFICAFEDVAPALVLYHGGTNWTRLQIEPDVLPLARGGAVADIDGDQDLDVVFGSETGAEIWWWENPSPRFDPSVPWTRHVVKNQGAGPNREMLFTDLAGTGRLQLVYWNAHSNAVFLAEIPREPRNNQPWEFTRVFSAPPDAPPIGSLEPADINIDGSADLLAGSAWLYRTSALEFEATRLGRFGGRSAAGRFRESTIPQIVVAPDASPGAVYWYECLSSPRRPGAWAGRQLFKHPVNPAATLGIADFDKDANSDILLSELATGPGGPAPRAWIIYSDGHGNFQPRPFATGIEIFDAKISDLDADGNPDIVSVARSFGAPRLDIWLNQRVRKGPPIFPKTTGD